MPYYYFHLRDDQQFIWDDEGVDLPDEKVVYGAAASAAETLWADVLSSLNTSLDPMIVVTDEAGRLVHVRRI